MLIEPGNDVVDPTDALPTRVFPSLRPRFIFLTTRVRLRRIERTVSVINRSASGLDNKIIDPGPEVGHATGELECRERLGGMLNYYQRRAA